MLELPRNSNVLVVAAHPDDELLGCGATISRLVKERGCRARAVILGEGLTSRSDRREPAAWKDALERHKADVAAATSRIGYESFSLHDLPDNRFDSVDLLDIVKIVESEKAAFDPALVLTHHGSDTNIDHRRTFDAVITAFRPLPGEPVRSILSFETPSSTEWQAPNYANYFRPNLFVSVEEEHLSAKISAMEAYSFEKRDFPHPRSAQALRVLAQRWGVAIGRPAAEAFMLVRGLF